VLGYPFTCPIQIRYADVDAMNHVNNAVFLTYLEVGRVRLWAERLDFAGTARDLPFILARVGIDYRAPIRLGSRVELGMGVSALGRSSFTFACRLEADGHTAADAETVQVYFDYGIGRPRPIPDELRRNLARLAMPGIDLTD
jgi:acyl-CoA thioester hydrolase